MRAEPGGSQLLDKIAQSSVDDRVAWLAEMRAAGIRSVWQQVDRAGIVDPIEVAEFVLGRLYPDLRDASLDEVLRQLRVAQAAGTWSGFERPGGPPLTPITTAGIDPP